MIFSDTHTPMGVALLRKLMYQVIVDILYSFLPVTSYLTVIYRQRLVVIEIAVRIQDAKILAEEIILFDV